MKTLVVPVPTMSQARLFAAKLLLVVLICYLAYVVREIWLPLGLSLILALVLDPIVDRMELRGWKRTWATAFIFGSFVICVGGILFLVGPYIIDQGREMESAFAKYFPDRTQKGLEISFQKLNVPANFARLGARAFETLQGEVQRSGSSIAESGMRVATNLIWVVIIPIVSFYMILDFHVILAKALLIVPPKNRSMVQTAVSEITQIFGKYLRGLGLVSLLNGIATGILLSVLRVPSAILLGVIAGILYSVPYIGAVMTVALTAAVALLGGGVHLALLAVGASTILHQIIFDQIISPRVLGSHVGLHPILSIIALLMGNLLLGIIGMILAVPIAACIQIAVLSVVPKLAVDVEIPAPRVASEDIPVPSEVVQGPPVKIDATEQMKASVATVVEEIDAKVESGIIDPRAQESI